MRKQLRTALVLFPLVALAANAEEKQEKFAVFIAGLQTAAPVTQSLIKQLNASKPFEAVGQNDRSKVVVLVSCLDRSEDTPFACMYVSQYNGATFKTFLGGGLYVARTADDVATNFFKSIVQDILERFDDTDKDNLRQALEACLLLTDTKCNVPDPLQKEFNAKQLTLGQYLLKKHQ